MALGDQRLFTGTDSEWDDSWGPSVPEANATLWRYMSFAKFNSLLERKELFFSLVGEMEDKYEGFIYPPKPRDQEDRLQQAERLGCEMLHTITKTDLINCWTESDHESKLMWEAYAGTEGVAIRTTFQNLEESIRSVAELPITFGQVEYVDYSRTEVSRFVWAPLFHKRMEYREEREMRAVLPGPYLKIKKIDELINHDILLDPDVAEQRGRYIPVELGVLVKEVVLPPYATSWFAQVVRSVMRRSQVRACVTRSTIESPPHESGKRVAG